MRQRPPASAPRQRRSSIDLDKLVERLGGAELAVRVARRFVAYYVGPLTELTARVGERDGQEVRRLAHSLKGSVSYFGVEPLVSNLKVLQEAGEQEDWPAADRLLATVTRELDEFAEALRAWAGSV